MMFFYIFLYEWNDAKEHTYLVILATQNNSPSFLNIYFIYIPRHLQNLWMKIVSLEA